MLFTSTHRKAAHAMEHKNQVPNLTPKAKAARRRSVIWSVVLFLVVVGCIIITILPRYYR
jgi:hypothetical protein